MFVEVARMPHSHETELVPFIPSCPRGSIVQGQDFRNFVDGKLCPVAPPKTVNADVRHTSGPKHVHKSSLLVPTIQQSCRRVQCMGGGVKNATNGVREKVQGPIGRL